MMRMHRRAVSTAAVWMMMILVLTGCTSEASNIGVAKDKKGNVVDTGFTASTVGSYDSADTAVVLSTDLTNKAVTLNNIETGKQYTLYYDGTTYVKDKYDGSMTISQIKAGDIVDVTFLKGKKKLASIKLSPEAWIFDEINNYDLVGVNKTASIGSQTYSMPDSAVVLSEGSRVEKEEVVSQDVVTISGIDHKIYSVSVDKGHGYLRLKNDQILLGGWIEVGNRIIRQITEDMLLVVPEGSYQVVLSNGGVGCVKDIKVERNKEVVLDAGDVEIPENKTGKIFFDVTPETAKVSVDGNLVDTSRAVEIRYGIHQVQVEASGYDTLTKYIQVGSEYATISFTLEETRKQDASQSLSANSTERIPWQDTLSSLSENTLSSLSENALGTSDNNKVYIDSPKGVEVYVDSNYIGIAPVRFTKSAGRHEITLRKEGYETKSYTIYLDNTKKDETYSFSDLKKLTTSSSKEEVKKANISFIVKPEDAKVSVDGKLIKEKDLKGTIELTHGSHKIHIEAEGYETIDETITVSKDEQFTYELKKLVSVTFKIEPEDADITKFVVDDEEKNYDEEIELSSGSHKVSIEVTNYQDYNENVTVDPENPEITIHLKELSSESENTVTGDD